ncbi:MAG: AbrB/MazE/SpoVT family DNA-binding domain-containing protein [Thermoproteota archaeon]
MGFYRRLTAFAERIRPGLLVPKGDVFMARLGSERRITIPEGVRKRLGLRKGERVDVYLRAEPLRLNRLQHIAFRIRPGIFFPKGYHFTAKIDESWRFNVPEEVVQALEKAGRTLKDGDEIEVYIRKYGEAI